MTVFLSQREFSSHPENRDLPPGQYFVEYNDTSHLSKDEWRRIISVSIESDGSLLDDSDFHFKQKVDIDRKFTEITKSKPSKLSQSENSGEIITSNQGDKIVDILSQSFLRTGILAPNINTQTAIQICELIKSKGVILIPDTNSLCNGTLHWLLRVLRGSSVWILPFVMSLTQMQQREANLKSLARNTRASNLSQALRSRTMVSAGLGLLERNRHRYQVLELDPSLLRYMRAGGKNGFDQDEGDVLEDRLLIEGVHAIFRNSRTRTTQLVVTSDVLLARVLGAEGIPYICLPVPAVSEHEILNVRYDPWARTYVGASLSAQLWDLAHTFSAVRLTASEKSTSRFSLSCYWAGKQPQDWTAEHLELKSFSHPTSSLAKPLGEGDDAKEAMPADKPNESTSQPQPSADIPTPPPAIAAGFSSASLPQASLQSTLRIAGHIYNSGAAAVDSFISDTISRHGGSKGNIQRSLEILLRSKIIQFDGVRISPTDELDRLDSNIRSSDLDSVSQQLENFEPYRLLLNLIRESGIVGRDDIHPALEAALRESVAHEAAIRLVRYPILLGQCWTDGTVWRDGSSRPSDDEFVEAFGKAYDVVAGDNIAKISDFLPELCRTFRLSPWAAQRLAQRHARRLSTSYSFQYAVGGKPSSIDQVLTGSLVDLHEIPVPMDRIEIGGRPVLTVGRVKE
ncbi:hypothetical protein [Bosea sp. NPDC055594]